MASLPTLPASEKDQFKIVAVIKQIVEYLTNAVTAAAAFGTDNLLLRSDGTGRGAQASPVVVADTTGALSRSGGGGIPVQGTNTNDSAASGFVGEIVESLVATGDAVNSPGSGTPFDITSISVPAGNWNIEGAVWAKPAGTTTTSFLIGWTHTVSATNPTSPNGGSKVQFIAAIGAGLETGLPTGAQNVKLSSTTTYYLGASIGFATSTMQAYGYIKATRIR